MRALDEALFRWINSWPDALAPVFTFLSEGNKSWPVRIGFTVLVAAMILRGPRTRQAALIAIVAWLVSNELTDALKLAFGMPRPSAELNDAIVRVSRLTSPGTASAHAASMGAVAFVFTRALGIWGAPWIAAAFLVGLSRVFVGVHYPSQVLLGWACGILVAWIAVTTFEVWLALRARRGQGQADQDGTGS